VFKDARTILIHQDISILQLYLYWTLDQLTFQPSENPKPSSKEIIWIKCNLFL